MLQILIPQFNQQLLQQPQLEAVMKIDNPQLHP
jgi:hypothetical protein